MHVSVRTLHGLRTLTRLADERKSPKSASELAQQKYVDRGYLTQILNTLIQADIVASKKGPSGGYYLNREPESITLGEIIRSLEGPTVISPCTQPRHSDCEIIPECSTQDVLSVVAEKIDTFLDHITLADLQEQYNRDNNKVSEIQ